MKEIFKKSLRALLGDYGIYRVFALDLDSTLPIVEDPNLCEVDRDDMLQAESPELRAQAWYGGEGSIGVGYRVDGRLVAARWAWYGDRYKQRDFWPLKNGEAKIVHTFVLPEARGLGIASKMGFFGYQLLMKEGFTRLYSRVWYNHTASLSVIRKNGWRQIGLGVVMNPFRSKKPMKITFKTNDRE